jgi:hypothetical protein
VRSAVTITKCVSVALQTLIGKVTLTVGRLKSTTKSSTSRRSSGVSLNKQKHGKG